MVAWVCGATGSPPSTEMVRPPDGLPNASGGRDLLFNHLHGLKHFAGFPSHGSDTGARELACGLVFSVQGVGQPIKCPVLLAVDAVTLDVEVVSNRHHPLILGTVGEEEAL